MRAFDAEAIRAEILNTMDKPKLPLWTQITEIAKPDDRLLLITTQENSTDFSPLKLPLAAGLLAGFRRGNAEEEGHFGTTKEGTTREDDSGADGNSKSEAVVASADGKNLDDRLARETEKYKMRRASESKELEEKRKKADSPTKTNNGGNSICGDLDNYDDSLVTSASVIVLGDVPGERLLGLERFTEQTGGLCLNFTRLSDVSVKVVNSLNNFLIDSSTLLIDERKKYFHMKNAMRRHALKNSNSYSSSGTLSKIPRMARSPSGKKLSPQSGVPNFGGEAGGKR